MRIIVVNTAFFLLSLFAMLANEGIGISFDPPAETADRMFIYRFGCSPPRNISPTVGIGAPPPPILPNPLIFIASPISPADYLSGSVEGVMEINTNGGVLGCQRIVVDLSSMKQASLIAASALSFPSPIPLPQSMDRQQLENMPSPKRHQLTIRELETRRFELLTADDPEMSRLDLQFDGILKRLGGSEFGAYIHVSIMDGDTGKFFTGAPADIRPASIDQTIAPAGIRTLSAPQLSTTIYSGALQDFKNSISIILSILVGLFGGVLYESVLSRVAPGKRPERRKRKAKPARAPKNLPPEASPPAALNPATAVVSAEDNKPIAS